MNLASALALYGGGPGSGCHGENCGRPPGHSGPHREAAKTWIEKKADEKLKKKLFRQARRKAGFQKSVVIHKLHPVTGKEYKVRESLPTGLSPEALDKQRQRLADEGGTLLRKEVKELKKEGQVIDMKSPGLKLDTDVSRVVKTTMEKIRVVSTNPNTGKSKVRVYKVEVETVKRVGGASTPKMGKVRGRNVPEGPPNRAHSQYGNFNEAMRHHDREGNRTFIAFEARHPDAPGANVFVNKITEGNKSRVQIQEVRRSENANIEETRLYKFASGKAAKDYLHQRYGIKKLSWTK